MEGYLNSNGFSNQFLHIINVFGFYILQFNYFPFLSVQFILYAYTFPLTFGQHCLIYIVLANQCIHTPSHLWAVRHSFTFTFTEAFTRVRRVSPTCLVCGAFTSPPCMATPRLGLMRRLSGSTSVRAGRQLGDSSQRNR